MALGLDDWGKKWSSREKPAQLLLRLRIISTMRRARLSLSPSLSHSKCMPRRQSTSHSGEPERKQKTANAIDAITDFLLTINCHRVHKIYYTNGRTKSCFSYWYIHINIYIFRCILCKFDVLCRRPRRQLSSCLLCFICFCSVEVAHSHKVETVDYIEKHYKMPYATCTQSTR